MSHPLQDDSFVQAAEGALYKKPKISPKTVVLRNDSGQILYSGVGLYYDKFHKPQYTEIVQVFASCQQAASIAFHNRFRYIHFAQVFVAPAIGFFVHDNHGDVLSTGGARPGANALDKGTEYEEAK